MKQTDLKGIQEIALMFLHQPIHNELFAQHPFTQVSIVGDSKGNMLNLTKREDYDKWVRIMKDVICRSNDFSRIYYLITKPYKLVFMKYCKQYLSEELFAQYLGEAYTDEEFPSKDINVTRVELLRWFKSADKQYLMSKEDYEFYCNLRYPLVCYRGVDNMKAKRGLSWTFDKEKAIWFGNRFGKEGILLRATVERERSLAYFNNRGENEIIVDTRKLKIEEIK